MTQPVLATLRSATQSALASGGEHPLLDFDYTAFLQLGLFLAVAFLATQLLFRPYLKMRADRAEGTEGARKKAAEMTAEADAKLADYDDKLATARARANDERRKVRAEAAAHQREVAEKTRLEIAEATEEADRRLAEQSAAARDKLLPRAESLGLQIASRLLGREVKA